jgi:hypothetical protein
MNIFLLQGLLGVLNLPASYVALFVLNQLGRRRGQVLFMPLVGISIFAIVYVPQGEKCAQNEKEIFFSFSQNFAGHTFIKLEDF